MGEGLFGRTENRLFEMIFVGATLAFVSRLMSRSLVCTWPLEASPFSKRGGGEEREGGERGEKKLRTKAAGGGINKTFGAGRTGTGLPEPGPGSTTTNLLAFLEDLPSRLGLCIVRKHESMQLLVGSSGQPGSPALP